MIHFILFVEFYFPVWGIQLIELIFAEFFRDSSKTIRWMNKDSKTDGYAEQTLDDKY